MSTKGTLPSKHFGRTITFDHIRYIPVKTGFKAYYISRQTDQLDDLYLKDYMIDAWEEFLVTLNGNIPRESEVEMFLRNTFFKQEQEEDDE